MASARATLPEKLRAAATIRASANGRPRHDKTVLVKLILGALNDKPLTFDDVRALAQQAGYKSAAGALNKWCSGGYVTRRRNGAYTLTAKGARRLDALQAATAAPAGEP